MPDGPTITAEVTFADLIANYDDELDELREGYYDAVDLIHEEFGADALDRPIPTDPESDDLARLATLRATASAYEDTAKQLQRRNHALETIAERCDGDAFSIKMLTGDELMAVETDLKMAARDRDTDVGTIEHVRKGLVVDVATVDAPGGIPTDEEGSPTPTAVGNPLTFALYDMVENLNQAGAVDFRAPGFDDRDLAPVDAPSEPQTPVARALKLSEGRAEGTTPGGDTPDSGDFS